MMLKICWQKNNALLLIWLEGGFKYAYFADVIVEICNNKQNTSVLAIWLKIVKNFWI